MNIPRQSLRELHHELSRRDLLRLAGVGVSGLGLAAVVGCGSDDGNGSPTSTPSIVVDPPPETTTIRLARETLEAGSALIFLAEQFLAAEGFTDVQYIDVSNPDPSIPRLASGELDITLEYPSSVTVEVDSDDRLVILAGVVNSFWDLVGSDRVRSLRDLKGKKIWVPTGAISDVGYTFWAGLLAYVGIDRSEVEYVDLSLADLAPRLLDGTIDAWVTVEPYSTTLRNANIGHVIVAGAIDPPWSQYFGAIATANRAFVEKHPAATKRALRAILKAADLCAREPERAARYLVDRGFTSFTYDESLDVVTGASYTAWREFNPEDTVRFYALRLAEAGLVRSTPDELIARATDWRYLDEIKRELGVA